MKETLLIIFCFFGFCSCKKDENTQMDIMRGFTTSDSVYVSLDLLSDSTSVISNTSYLYPVGVIIEIKNMSGYDVFLPDFLPLSSNIKIFLEGDSIGRSDYTDTWSKNLIVIPEDYFYGKDSAFVTNELKLEFKDVVDSLLESHIRKNKLPYRQQHELEQKYKYFDLQTLLLRKKQTYRGVISIQPLMLQSGTYEISFEYSGSKNYLKKNRFHLPNIINGYHKWTGDLYSNKLKFVNP